MAPPSLVLIVNILASCTALYMCFSPAPAILRIHKNKTTGHMPVLPLVAQWAYNHIWMLYGFVTGEYFPLFATYAVGNAVSVLFLVAYYMWAEEQRSYVVQLSLLASLFNIATAGYTFFGPSILSAHEIEQGIGVIAIACGLIFYASPFATIRIVLLTKNAISIPIGMVLVGTISNAVWILYGALVRDLFIVCPTLINFGLCLVQLTLYAMYRPPRRKWVQSDSSNTRTDACPESARSEHRISFVHLESPKYEESHAQAA